jgi:hypothetical protein
MNFRTTAALLGAIAIIGLAQTLVPGRTAAQTSKEPTLQTGVVVPKTTGVPTLRTAAKQLVAAIDPRGQVKFDLVITGSESDQFECTSTNSRVRASCLAACAFAQTVGCSCSSVQNGCSCECAPPGDVLTTRSGAARW